MISIIPKSTPPLFLHRINPNSLLHFTSPPSLFFFNKSSSKTLIPALKTQSENPFGPHLLKKPSISPLNVGETATTTTKNEMFSNERDWDDDNWVDQILVPLVGFVRMLLHSVKLGVIPLQPCASLLPVTAGGRGDRWSSSSVSSLSVLAKKNLESKRRRRGGIFVTTTSLETPVVGQVTEVNKDTLCSYIVKEVNTSERLKAVSRRSLFLFLVSSGLFATSSASVKAKSKSPYDDKRLLEQNRRIQEANNVPMDFPNFIREGFEVKVVTNDSFVKCNSGLIYLDIAAGKGDSPKDGQQVTFHYIGYNESGRRIDSTYLQGTPAKIRMGTNALVPGFEEGIRDMKPGGKRRIVIPPELGPPVGPSTFFSSKQFEVFDVELLSVQNCERRTILAFYSDVVCN